MRIVCDIDLLLLKRYYTIKNKVTPILVLNNRYLIISTRNFKNNMKLILHPLSGLNKGLSIVISKM
jgi:hypothetical protein